MKLHNPFPTSIAIITYKFCCGNIITLFVGINKINNGLLINNYLNYYLKKYLIKNSY